MGSGRAGERGSGGVRAILMFSRSPALPLALLLVCLLLSTGPFALEVRLIGAYGLFVALPGWLAVRLALGATSQAGGLERALLALGVGYSLAMLLGLIVHTLFRPAAVWQITAGAALMSLWLW